MRKRKNPNFLYIMQYSNKFKTKHIRENDL